MSKISDGGAAFARPLGSMQGRYSDAQEGMSLRDWFAGKALQGLIASGGQLVRPNDPFSTLAEIAYAMADAMLAVRGAK